MEYVTNPLTIIALFAALAEVELYSAPRLNVKGLPALARREKVNPICFSSAIM